MRRNRQDHIREVRDVRLVLQFVLGREAADLLRQLDCRVHDCLVGEAILGPRSDFGAFEECVPHALPSWLLRPRTQLANPLLAPLAQRVAELRVPEDVLAVRPDQVLAVVLVQPLRMQLADEV